ncbi:MAG TPA: hypothetical protein VFM37_12255 [Pseudonocardiaceae bacterium]|nr:hypothetical protein [Pseudonocardiaceae bacterium]
MRTRPLAAILLVLLAGALLAGTTACARTPETGPDSGPGAPSAQPEQGADRSAAIYAAVLRRYLTTGDHSFGDGHRFATVYVLDHAVTGAGDPMRTTTSGERKPIPEDIQHAVVQSLADLGAVEFVAARDDVVETANGCERVRGDRAVLVTLGPLPDRGDRVEVGVYGFVACLAATWLTYVVERGGSGWAVKGTTGPVAIS